MQIKNQTKNNADGTAPSDEERRKNAEAMMHKIAAMMDIGMDDDESDDEGSKQDNKES